MNYEKTALFFILVKDKFNRRLSYYVDYEETTEGKYFRECLDKFGFYPFNPIETPFFNCD